MDVNWMQTDGKEWGHLLNSMIHWKGGRELREHQGCCQSSCVLKYTKIHCGIHRREQQSRKSHHSISLKIYFSTESGNINTLPVLRALYSLGASLALIYWKLPISHCPWLDSTPVLSLSQYHVVTRQLFPDWGLRLQYILTPRNNFLRLFVHQSFSDADNEQ